MHPHDLDYQQYPSHTIGWDVWYIDNRLHYGPGMIGARSGWTAKPVVRFHPK
jgi:hypothetical protein